jgi:hypothetical protein
MKSETEPVTDDEWLLRRIRFENIREGKTPLISPRTFEPRVSGRDPDSDGISLYRLSCLNSPEEILTTADPARIEEYGIVKIPVSLIRELGLTISIQPDERIKGHVTIPELSASNFKANKTTLKLVTDQFSLTASDPANMLIRPLRPASPAP